MLAKSKGWEWDEFRPLPRDFSHSLQSDGSSNGEEEEEPSFSSNGNDSPELQPNLKFRMEPEVFCPYVAYSF